MSRVLCIATVAFLLSACSSIGRDPLFRLTLKVVDDEGTPVAGAKARIGAERRSKPGESEGKGVFAEGVTDEKGIFSGEVEAWDATRAGYRVEKEGYYGVWLSYSARSHSRGKWQPWNPTIEVVLKRIKNPVPMYAKRVSASLPKLDEPVGYDFMIGDWVAPHGKGKIADMVFRGKLRKDGDRTFDWELAVTFSNPGDGLQRFSPGPDHAAFRSDYEAPEEGYLAEWKLRRWREGPTVAEQTTFDPRAGYYFRVRSVLGEDGKVKKALYGKIYGDFFDLTYYLNPDGTRNIECDPKRNLLRPAVVNNRNRDLYQVGP